MRKRKQIERKSESERKEKQQTQNTCNKSCTIIKLIQCALSIF